MRDRPYRPSRGRTDSGLPVLAATSILAAAIVVMGLVPGGADAAPNPLRDKTVRHTVSIGADGSYSVRMDTRLDLALETGWSFGSELHDGFRLPDTESLLPPYLRAEYSQPQGTIDATPVEASIVEELHSVDIGFSTGDLDPGIHRGVLDYHVSGAAIKGEDAGVIVYFRPLEVGELVIESEAPITAVGCEVFSPDGEPCGDRTGQTWTVPAEELVWDHHSIDAVRISIDADPHDIADPVIDD